MSRIHEAIKKAEQERVAAAPLQAAPPPIVEAMPAVSEPVMVAEMPAVSPRETAPTRAGIFAPSSILAPTPDFLRFEELKRRCAQPDWHFDPNVNVFANPGLSEHGAEQFRTLRSRLYQIRNDQNLKTLLVTSSVPGEGKTFVSANLAQAIVRQPDKRALIIDADLRRPRIHTVLGAPSSPGLADYLRGDIDEIGVIQIGPEGNIGMIPGGSDVTNPSELVSNGRLAKLLNRLAPVFDWIILDSPPCLPVADASILAGLCDGVLLVVKAGSTPSTVAQRARQELHPRNVVGVVLNAVGEAHMYNSVYYQGYQEGYAPVKEPTK
jgi:protein-tyrosine kinase